MQKSEKSKSSKIFTNIKIDKIIRSSRKTVALEITDGLELVVRAPNFLSMYDIEKIVKRKSKWIENTRNKLQKRTKGNHKKLFEIGDIFYLKGEKLKLHSIFAGKNKIVLQDNNIILFKMPGKNPRELFISWYKRQAKDFINQRLRQYSEVLGLYPSSVRITSAKKRWGSCSGKNSINFTYRLIMVPVKIIDYVIVHELIHIEEKNHSRRFWEKVEAIIPDYRDRRKWLSENGHLYIV